MSIGYVYNDGGRSKYFKAEKVGDCAVRAIAIASGTDYKEVYDYARKVTGESPRNGILPRHIRKIAQHFGGRWVPTMSIGSGCKVHLRADELPKGRLVCSLSKHETAVIDGVINDTYDPSRGGTRCVYGYHIFKTNQQTTQQ